MYALTRQNFNALVIICFPKISMSTTAPSGFFLFFFSSLRTSFVAYGVGGNLATLTSTYFGSGMGWLKKRSIMVSFPCFYFSLGSYKPSPTPMFNPNDLRVPIIELRTTLAKAPDVVIIVKIYNGLIRHSSSRDITFLISVDKENVFEPVLLLFLVTNSNHRKIGKATG